MFIGESEFCTDLMMDVQKCGVVVVKSFGLLSKGGFSWW